MHDDPARDDELALHRHQRRLASRTAQLGGDAEDLASEAVARSLRHAAPDGRREPWLERIFHNLVADRARRGARRARALAALTKEMAAEHSGPGDPEAALLAAERRRLLESALPRMAPTAREMLRQRFWEERDDGEVARALGIAPGTVRTRIHRALAQLRQMLGQLRGLTPLWWCGPQPAAMALMPLALSVMVAAGGVGATQVSPAPAAKPAVSSRGAKSPAANAPVSPAPAAAATPAQPRVSARSAERVSSDGHAPVLRFHYDPDDIAGDLQRPDDFVLFGPPPRARSASLIEIPSSFAGEIVEAIEDL